MNDLHLLVAIECFMLNAKLIWWLENVIFSQNNWIKCWQMSWIYSMNLSLPNPIQSTLSHWKHIKSELWRSETVSWHDCIHVYFKAPNQFNYHWCRCLALCSHIKTFNDTIPLMEKTVYHVIICVYVWISKSVKGKTKTIQNVIHSYWDSKMVSGKTNTVASILFGLLSIGKWLR